MSLYLTPLNPHLKEIRILHLQPLTSGPSIRCSTSTVSLLSQPSPSYEALSYVWGDASIQQEIQFDGAPFPVTRNLFTALQHLRLPDQERRLWVDALCINQKDIKERNEQVAMMGEIYVYARPVLIFLGEADEGSNEAFNLISRVSEEGEIEDNVSRKLFSFYMNLVEREWFTRLWTVQELVLASQDPMVGCGFSWISWSVLLRVWQRVALREFGEMEMVISSEESDEGNESEELSGRRPNGIKIDLLSNLRKAVTEKKGEELRDLLLNTVSCKATEPRDRIYGLLGMLVEGHRNDITVDYSRPLGQVYAEAITHIFRRGIGPFLLSGMELAGPTPSDSSFPSWVPMFGSRTLPSPTKFHPPGVGASGAGSGADNGRVDEDIQTLRVRGMPIDTVLEKIEFGEGLACLTQLSAVEALVSKARQLATENKHHRLYLNSFKSKEPVWRTLIANKAYSGAAREVAPESYGEMYQRLRDNPDIGWNSDENPARKYILALMNHLPGSCFFISTTGFYGISQGTLEVGDHLAIWFGAPAPFALRPKAQVQDESGELKYAVCGVAYVAGIMDGEMVDEIYCEDLEDDMLFIVH
ncbi:related to heterokaryon incompatibility protein het-6 [Phialocephala subalpina]|uniref:Related to heterokaryon incompatibility protein het-6 n=1 Tax=Phialocephala subalpina TaxID=576137 RepID=A0A1L7WYE2_9HELO|nr:related to heterokaryon incompatibility protein het-6 [Phialocephala subalpina]